MRKYNITLCIFLLCLLCITHSWKLFVRKWRPQMSNEFDVLVFTQRWPLTVCFLWKENSESHICSLPKTKEWTIHGIWPTKYHRIGPLFCNKTLPFNANTLEPIKNELKENWIDIQKGSAPYSFWKHEWDKHGTCAVTINALDNELKYFQTGLKLLDNYNMIDVLVKANIIPNRKYMVQDILEAIKKILNKRGQVMCTKNEKTGELYIFEIRICFSKTLELIDCDGIYDFPTNCDKSKEITYPGYVPQNYHVVQI